MVVLAVELEEAVEGVLRDVDGRQVRQEVVAHQEGKEYEVVHHALHVPRLLGHVAEELELQVLPQDGQVQQLEARILGLLQDRARRVLGPRPAAAPTEVDHLTQQREVRLVGGQGKHDQVRVLAVHAVADVGLVVGAGLHVPDVLHDLVLALSRHAVPAVDDRQAPPQRILPHLLANEVPQVRVHLAHTIARRCSALFRLRVLIPRVLLLLNRWRR
jgi:hypothetical protein